MSEMWSALAVLLLISAQGLTLSPLTNESSSTNATVSDSIYRTSFDCTKARDYSVEQAICKNEELAKLDLEMSEAYKKRMGAVPASQKRELVRRQEEWLLIRNSYDANPYHDDAVGTSSDLADFYRNRIDALRSDQLARLNTKLPQEYDWLKAIAPDGLSKGFSIGRGHLGCEDPCKKRPSLYKLFSIWGGGIGEEPGDINTPFAKVAKRLAVEGWTQCRSADDSGKPTMDYFTKQDKMIAISSYHSMGAGNSITLSITTSGPLPEKPGEVSNPTVTITSDWPTYSSADEGFQVRYPPDWWVRNDKVPNRRAKYLTFGAKDYSGNFSIAISPKEFLNNQVVNKGSEPPDLLCGPSAYSIAGFPSRGCLSVGENVGPGTCTRSLVSLSAETPTFYLTFGPGASIVEGSNQYKLTDLYEKILSTIVETK